MKRVATYLFLIFTPQVLPAATGYLVHNLVVDDASTATADFYDPRLRTGVFLGTLQDRNG